MPRSVYLLSLGCPRNLVDSEVLMGRLKANGFKISDDASGADALIVNTCAFIEKAKEESVDAILALADIKKKNARKNIKLIVAGCLSQRYSSEISRRIKEVDGIFGCSDFPKIPAFLMQGSGRAMEVASKPSFIYIGNERSGLMTPRHFAYVKIQEGCMNNCSYCVIPKLRGSFRSRRMEDILAEVKKLSGSGVKEINVIGQDTTLYGADIYGSSRTAGLLDAISAGFAGGWVRLLYTHPAHLKEELIDVIASRDNICKYIDLPIQHINDRLLKKMNRRTSRKSIEALITKLRRRIKGVALRTAVIVGFPGETGKEFKELLGFVRDTGFERLGAFTYSREEGTPAYKYPGQISEARKQARYDAVLKAQQEISLGINKRLMGKTIKVLIDEKVIETPDKSKTIHHALSTIHYLGRTHMDAPEVDGQCYVSSKKPLKPGDIVKVRINDTMEYDLAGEAV